MLSHCQWSGVTAIDELVIDIARIMEMLAPTTVSLRRLIAFISVYSTSTFPLMLLLIKRNWVL
jgi:hypothetical protein